MIRLLAIAALLLLAGSQRFTIETQRLTIHTQRAVIDKQIEVLAEMTDAVSTARALIEECMVRELHRQYVPETSVRYYH